MTNHNIDFTSNFFDDTMSHIKCKEFFHFYFNEIGSLYWFQDCSVNPEIHNAIKSKYSSNPEFRVFVDTHEHVRLDRKVIFYHYVIDTNLMVFVNNSEIEIGYVYEDNNPKFEELKSLVSEYIECKKPKEPHFYLIIQGSYGLELKKFKAKRMLSDVRSHYNDSFLKVDEKIRKFIGNDQTGLVLLYGKSGTGKTSYIRHLICNTDKQFIYLPAELVTGLTKPVFLPFLAENPNCVYVIEDCEELLTQRTIHSSTNHALLNLLNISDGLIGDGINIKFICIFNASIKNIDEALMRKGRLMAKYEFKELAVEKANAIIDNEQLSIPKFAKPVTLSEMYHYDGDEELEGITKIGF
jgi:ATPase family associated with various cellular activities (AAA)